MRAPKSRWVGVGISLVVVAAVGGVTLGVTTLLGVTFQGSGAAHQGPASQRVVGALATANRDRLAICVQAVGVDPSLQMKAKSSIEAALVEVRGHPRWEPAGLKTPDPVVDIGCPSDPPLENVPDYPRRIEYIFGHVVSEASYYHTFVFILPAEDLEKLLGGSSRREANQEVFCDGDVCFTVTGGLYLAADELADKQFLIEKLEEAVGLEPGL